MTNASGKLVIIGILTIALASAGISWWFRYSATSRTVEFWGPGAAQLIRDAPIVELFRFEPSKLNDTLHPSELDEIGQFLDAPTNRRDISSARGLTHLRSALLEDRSYLWPAQPQKSSDEWRWIVLFRHETSGALAILIFSPDWQVVTKHGLSTKKVGGPFVTTLGVSSSKVLSCKPIAAGLAKLLGELNAQPAPAR